MSAAGEVVRTRRCTAKTTMAEETAATIASTGTTSDVASIAVKPAVATGNTMDTATSAAHGNSAATAKSTSRPSK